VPALQLVQLTLAGALEKVPGAHARHSVALELGAYVPARQSSHVTAPGLPL